MTFFRFGLTNFKPVLTDDGICLAWNNPNPSSMFKGEYMENVDKEFGYEPSDEDSNGVTTSEVREHSFIIDSRLRHRQSIRYVRNSH